MEAFCQAIVFVKPGVKAAQREAHRIAYGGVVSDKQRDERACMVMAKPAIKARVEELRKKVTDKAIKIAAISLADHLLDLKKLRDGAVMSEAFGPAVSAEMARGKASGLYVDKVEVTQKADELDELEAARSFLLAHGVDVKSPTMLQ